MRAQGMSEPQSELRSGTFSAVSRLLIHGVWFNLSWRKNSMDPDRRPAYISQQECHEDCQMYSVLMISQSFHDTQEGNKTNELVILRMKI